jgi:DNA-binding NarL/FixJ family response regulator
VLRVDPAGARDSAALAQRLTDREIAERLSISHRTAMNHTANILHKLGLESRRDVAGFVARHGLLPPHEPG